jgi:hypothetical protein
VVALSGLIDHMEGAMDDHAVIGPLMHDLRPPLPHEGVVDGIHQYLLPRMAAMTMQRMTTVMTRMSI